MRTDWMNRAEIRAATHAAPHHLDELVAMALLIRWAADRDQRVEVDFLAREAIAERAVEFDVLLDIGMEHDPSRGRFDHHQGGAGLEERSSAGLLFDFLYHDDPRAGYLRPAIRLIDQIDSGTTAPQPDRGEEERRAGAMISLSSLLKAVGGFRPDVARSRQCLELMELLVGRWFEQAERHLVADEVLARGRPVGDGLFLAPGDTAGHGLEERLRETDRAFVGYQPIPGRFQLVAISGTDRVGRARFPNDLPGASFVHPRGFLAVFPDSETAEAAVTLLKRNSTDSAANPGEPE